jgi:acyl-CoA dehydrogenase
MTTTMLESTVDDMLTRSCTRAGRQAVDGGGVLEPAWRALVEAGLPWVGLPEAAGGVGGDLTDLLTILRLCGRHAAPVPIAETALASWLFAELDRPIPALATTVPSTGPVDATLRKVGRGWRLDARLDRVPWARASDRIAVLVPFHARTHLVAVPLGACTVIPGGNLADEPRDKVLVADLELTGDDVTAARGDLPDRLGRRAALLRAAQMAGALEAVRDMTTAYAGDRRQFGKPLRTFQAIQQRLALTLEAVASTRLAVDVAGAAAMVGPAVDEIAAAKVIAGVAASEVVAHAHQVHGAIGLTEEYDLQLFVRRLVSWQWEFGSARHWSGVLARSVLARGGGAALWDTITRSLSHRAPNEARDGS